MSYRVCAEVSFNNENGTMLDYAMQPVYDLEAKKTDGQALGIILQSMFVEENVSIRTHDVRAAVRGQDSGREGRAGAESGKRNRKYPLIEKRDSR